MGTWDPHLFKDVFNLHECEVVVVEERVIGLRKIVRNSREIYLAEIQIGRGYRNSGIGTALLNQVIAESEQTGKRLWLQVIKGNPAERLYRRLGFIRYAETYAHRKLERWPQSHKGRRSRLSWSLYWW